jgi:hypothetical protein
MSGVLPETVLAGVESVKPTWASVRRRVIRTESRLVMSLPNRSSRCASAIAALVLLTGSPGSQAQTSAGQVVLIPTGAGAALGPTVVVARGVFLRLEAKGRKASLAYPAPPVPVDTKAVKGKDRQAAAKLKRAQSAFEMMEYDKVKTVAEEALKLYKELLKAGAPNEGYVASLHLLAAAAQLQGESKEAHRHMNDAYLFDQRPPSKKIFSPQVQEYYDQVRNEPPRKGTLTLSSTPPALILFNGKLFGMARGKATLRSGLYLVRFYLPGYGSRLRWVRVEPDKDRPLSITMERDESPEEENLGKLRQEVKAPEPGPATNQAVVDYGADEVVVVTGGDGCAAQGSRCPVELHWAKEGRWSKHRKAEHVVGRADDTAAVLLGQPVRTVVTSPTGDKPPLLPDRACTADNECSVKERCRDGRCIVLRRVTRTWWFWTLVGVGVAGITAAIVVPLTGPARPMIEVR